MTDSDLSQGGDAPPPAPLDGLARPDQLGPLFDAMSDGVMLLSLDGRIIDVNRAMAGRLGSSPEAVRGRRTSDLLPPDRTRDDAGVLPRLLAEPSHPIRTLSKIGERWVEATHYAIPGPTAAPDRMLIIVRDETERVRAETELRESREMLARAQAVAHFGSWDWDLVGNTLTWTPEVDRIYGRDPGTMQPSFAALVHRVDRSDRPDLIAAIRAAVNTGGRLEIRHRIVRLDGATRMVRSVGEVLRAEDGTPIRMTGTMLDVTDREEAEAHVARLLSALEQTDEAIIVADATGDETEYVSPAFARFVRPTPEVPPTSDIASTLPPGPAASSAVGGTTSAAIPERGFRLLAERIADPEQRSAFEAAITAEDPWAGTIVLGLIGDQREVEFTITPVRNAAGRIIGRIGNGHDVTAARASEVQLRRTQRLEAVGRLVGGIAHDFRNLLQVVTGGSEILLDVLPPDHPNRVDAEAIRDAGERAAELTGQLLVFSRDGSVRREEIDLTQLVRSQVGLLGRLIGENIRIVLDLEAADAVLGDPNRVDVILLNLVLNARDAMPDGGTLTIRTRTAPSRPEIPAEDGEVVLSVIDTGVGMDTSTRDRIFDPFFTTKEAGQGTGLGLWTVFGAVSELGGRIEVRSIPRHGTRFDVFLPVRPGRPTGRTDRAPIRAATGTGTILVVEDEPPVRTLVLTTLARLGYRAIAADGPRRALEIVRSGEAIDLVLSDVVMPDMNGPDLARAIAGIRPGLAVVFMSGWTADHLRDDAMLTRPGALILKPFTITGLATHVRGAMETGRSGSGPA